MKLKIKSSGIADRYDKNITHTQTQDVLVQEIQAWYTIWKSYFDPLLSWIREQDKLSLPHDKLSLPHLYPLVAGYEKHII